MFKKLSVTRRKKGSDRSDSLSNEEDERHEGDLDRSVFGESQKKKTSFSSGSSGRRDYLAKKWKNKSYFERKSDFGFPRKFFYVKLDPNKPKFHSSAPI